MKLSQLECGQKGYIVKVRGYGSFRKRILELGFIRGKEVEVIKEAPLKDPAEYRIMDYKVSLRKSVADMIDVVAIDDTTPHTPDSSYHGTMIEETLQKVVQNKQKEIQVAFVGNPNCGKTSLFNEITGENAKVGNYSGVTVDIHKGLIKYKDYTINIIDLPGTYSLTAYSPDEVYVRRYLKEQAPDIVLNVVSASNLERNLYLTTELIDMDLRLVGALNMHDELTKSGAIFDYQSFGKMTGIPFVPTVASKGVGIEPLLDEVIRVYEGNHPVVRHIHINYGPDAEKSIHKIRHFVNYIPEISTKVSPRFLAVKLLENDKEARDFIKSTANYDDIAAAVEKEQIKLKKTLNTDTQSIISEAKYGFIAGALKETYKEPKKTAFEFSQKIDTLLTHKTWGYPIFFVILFLMFKITFQLGAYPAGWIENGVASLVQYLGTVMPEGAFKALIINGIVEGTGSVLVFLPNIMLLYLFISLLEDSGYMARAAFIMDKLMHKLGLHGKSFIPLIMGFGCNVPAILASRSIENKNNRIVTILINPLMSCSARLPVYILICGAFFPDIAAYMMLLVYFYGILLAIVVAKLLRKYMFKKEEVPFIMELPPYRYPSLKHTSKQMWQKTSQFIKKIGGVVLISSFIIWFLSYYPKADTTSIRSSENTTELVISPDAAPTSYLERIGKGIEPVLKPLGLNWKVGVGLITGLVAKELIVSSITVMDDPESSTVSAFDGITIPSAIGLLFFVLIYSPCVATISAIKNETNSNKLALFAVFYTTAIAWIMAFTISTVGNYFF